MQGYAVVSLTEMVSQLGEEKVRTILSDFSCPLNKDVENFLRNKSIVFSNQGIAQTHLVFASHRGKVCLIGYFSLATKYFKVQFDKRKFSNTLRKRLNKFAKYDSELKAYIASAPLIAQLGKNFKNGYNKLISGDELLKLACDKVTEAQELVGGKLVYLECEDKQVLTNFYSENGFFNFGTRLLDSDEKDSLCGEYLVQMLKYL